MRGAEGEVVGRGGVGGVGGGIGREEGDVMGREGDGAKGTGRGAYVTAQSSGSMLASADFHGAEVEVVRSRCVSRVGVRGIVVRDTKFTFEVVTRGDVVKGRFLRTVLMELARRWGAGEVIGYRLWARLM